MCNNQLKLLSLLFFLIMFTTSHGTEDKEIIELDNVIVVTATRTPITSSELTRSLTIINKDEIERTPAQSLEDLLSGLTGVDIRRRGVQGVQADGSIRGGNFEQTLILIDGIKLSDPQTGHFNLDLPVSLSEIEQVEILKGAASPLYGPNAMNGVINIITSHPAKKRIRFESTAGDFGLTEQLMAVSFSHGAIDQSLLLNRRSSSGYIKNTEFEIRSISYRTDLKTSAGPLNFSARYSDKEFGAYKFYTDAFPNQWEATETLFLSANGSLQSGNVLISPRLFWRRHKDDFFLDRDRIDWNHNLHTTDSYGGEIQLTIETGLGETVLGGELAGEEIKSSNLSNHSRTRGGLFFEQRLSLFNNFSLLPGFSVYHHEGWGWGWWPSIDIGYFPTKDIRVYFNIGKAYRVPTFTELYYVSSANLGNPDLQPEESWSAEIGTCLKNQFLSTEISLFFREGTDMIDWVRSDPSLPWQVQNVSKFSTRGGEISMTFDIDKKWSSYPLNQVAVRYCFLDSDHKTDGDQSKYLLEYLAHQAAADIDIKWLKSLHQRWSLRYSKRFGGEEYFTVDTRLRWQHGNLGLFFDITNLTDIDYVEVGTIPMPGRWFRTGIKLNIDY